MKKLVILAMLIASVSAKAQTNLELSGIIPIVMGDSVVFNKLDDPFDYIILKLNKRYSNGTIINSYGMKTELQVELSSQLTNKWNISHTNYSFPYTISATPNFTVSLGESLSVEYYLPMVFQYKYYYNYYLNYNSIFIKICAISSNGEIMGTFNVAEIPISVSMVQANDYYHTFLYWDCEGLGNSAYNATYYSDGVLTADRILPTVDFMDLWYTEFDANPIEANLHVHDTFVAAIDHFAIGLGFGN